MTEETGGTGRVPEPEMPAETTGATPVVTARSTSTPESMIMIGSVIILGGWLLFGLILDEYFTDWTALLFAVFALALVMGTGDSFAHLAPKATLLKLCGYAIAILAGFELVWDIRFAGGVLDDFVEILGALALFGGSALVFLGARSIDD